MLQRYGKLFEKQNKIMFFDVLLLRNEKKSRKSCLIREKVVTFRMVKLNMLLSIFLITK